MIRAAWLVLILYASCGFAAPMNIVVVLVDDLGWSDLACYGSDWHRTPRIDSFAKQSLRFSDAYSAAPVCSPTRAALMTGKHPARLGITTWYESSREKGAGKHLLTPPETNGNLSLAETTIAERLHDAGYYTAIVGKWHLGDAEHYPEVHGFDANLGGTHWGAPSTHFYPFHGRWSGSKEMRYVPGFHRAKPGEFLADRMTTEAIEIIDEVKDRPFFLYLSYHSVHTPIQADPKEVAEYESRINPKANHRNPTYAAMVTNLDRNVGRLLDHLDAAGLADRTVVIFTSDNGGFINEHRGMPVTSNTPLRSGKGSLYEGGIRVPLMIRMPGAPTAGQLTTVPAVTMDLYPTMLEAVGVDLPESDRTELDGISLLPLVEGESDHLQERPLFFHFPHYYPTTTPVSSIRVDDWKLLEYFEDGRTELYDLEEDPGEHDDISSREPSLVRELIEKLGAWRREIHAPMPTPNPKSKAEKSA